MAAKARLLKFAKLVCNIAYIVYNEWGIKSKFAEFYFVTNGRGNPPCWKTKKAAKISLFEILKIIETHH